MWRYLHRPKMSVCEGNHINLRCGYVNVPTYTQDVGSWLVPSAFRKTEIFRGTIFNPSPPILPSLSGEPFNYQSINQSINQNIIGTDQTSDCRLLGNHQLNFSKNQFFETRWTCSNIFPKHENTISRFTLRRNFTNFCNTKSPELLSSK